MKQLYDRLRSCAKEEEVKAGFCRFFKMKIFALRDIDHYTESVLFEFKYDRNFKNPENVARVLAQTRDYAKFYAAKVDRYDWDHAPSTPRPRLVGDVHEYLTRRRGGAEIDKQTDLLTPNGVRAPTDDVSRVSGEQIRLLNPFPQPTTRSALSCCRRFTRLASSTPTWSISNDPQTLQTRNQKLETRNFQPLNPSNLQTLKPSNPQTLKLSNS